MKNIFILLFGLSLCLFFIGCEAKKDNLTEENSSIFRETFFEVKDLNEVKDIAGFPIKIPEQIFEKDFRSEIRAIEGKVIQVTYYGIEQLIIIRKAIDSGEDDVSRDFNDYPEQFVETVGGVKVLLRGNEGKINVMSWSYGNFNYAINVNPGGIGFNKDDVYKIMEQIE